MSSDRADAETRNSDVKPGRTSVPGAEIEGALDAGGKRFAIVAPRWHGPLVEQLISGSIETILARGGSREKITTIRIPGSFEIPLTCKQLSQSKNFDAIVVVGVLIRGDTEHFRLITDAITYGITKTMLEFGVPIGFGVVAAYSMEDAKERCGELHSNKGAEAALAAIEMCGLIPQVCSERRARMGY